MATELRAARRPEYLDHVAACADCGASLVAQSGALVQLPPSSIADDSVDEGATAAERQARLDLRTGIFAIVAGFGFGIITIVVPTTHGAAVLPIGPILYGVYRLMRGLNPPANK